MPFSHGKDGGVCVFVCFLRRRMFSHHPVGEGLAPPAGFWNFSIQRWVLRPLRRRAGSSRPTDVIVRGKRAGQETRPYKAISVMRDMATAAALKPRLSLWNQTGSRKRRRGGTPARPYGVSGKRKQNRGGAGKQKRTKPQNIPELRPFYPYCARLRSFISCSYSRREASASLDMGRMTKMLKMVIRPMPTSPRSHTKV